MYRLSAAQSQSSEETEDEPRTLAEAVYRRLRSDILWGQLPPEAALRSDRLRETYSIGISPLREALSRLTAERLVTAIGQRGFRVAPLTVDDVRDTLETRIVLESEALRRSIAAGDISWEKNIIANLHALSRLPIPDRAGAAAEVWARHHREFHLALIAASRSRWLFEFAGLLFDQAERHRAVTMRIVKMANVARDALKEHKEIADATLARDAASAVKLLGRHYRSTANLLIEVIERNSLGIDREKIGLVETSAAQRGTAKKGHVTRPLSGKAPRRTPKRK